jgi:hypothetical protein
VKYQKRSTWGVSDFGDFCLVICNLGPFLREAFEAAKIVISYSRQMQFVRRLSDSLVERGYLCCYFDMPDIDVNPDRTRRLGEMIAQADTLSL